MSDSATPQDDAAMSPASAGSLENAHSARHDAEAKIIVDGIAEIMRIASEPDWIPVTERLPKEGDQVIVWMPDCPHHPCGMDMGSCMTDSRGVSWMVSGGRSAFPTHWMPLPAPPTDGR